MTTDPLLQPLPLEYLEGIPGPSSHENLPRVLLDKTSLSEDRKASQYDSKIEHKSMLLHPTTTSTNADSRARKAQLIQDRRAAKRKPRPLSAREKRRLGLHLIPKEAQKYSTYEPLHALWTGYMREVVQNGGYEGKLLKADYHGAHLTVTKSTCPSTLFLHGIVIKETRHTFVIATQGDTIKTIPKRSTVFEFRLSLGSSAASSGEQESAKEQDYLRWEIHGEHFGHRAAERVGKKFKGKHTVDI